jgi:hypothetical protein
VFRVYGTIETTQGEGLKIVPAEAMYEVVLRRLCASGPGLRREEGGDDAQFLLGLPRRLRGWHGWMWADLLKPTPEAERSA